MLFTAFQIILQIVKSNHGLKIAVLFTLRESHATRTAGKPRAPHLLRCQGLAVGYYSFTLDALDLPARAGSDEQHPRLLQH